MDKFLEIQKKNKPDIIEIHNRPIYIKNLISLNSRLVLYFHNDPVTMIGSKTVQERIDLLNTCSKIIFNSEWSKKQFLKDLKVFITNLKNLKLYINLLIKKKLILN